MQATFQRLLRAHQNILCKWQVTLRNVARKGEGIALRENVDEHVESLTLEDAPYGVLPAPPRDSAKAVRRSPARGAAHHVQRIRSAGDASEHPRSVPPTGAWVAASTSAMVSSGCPTKEAPRACASRTRNQRYRCTEGWLAGHWISRGGGVQNSVTGTTESPPGVRLQARPARQKLAPRLLARAAPRAPGGGRRPRMPPSDDHGRTRPCLEQKFRDIGEQPLTRREAMSPPPAMDSKGGPKVAHRPNLLARPKRDLTPHHTAARSTLIANRPPQRPETLDGAAADRGHHTSPGPNAPTGWIRQPQQHLGRLVTSPPSPGGRGDCRAPCNVLAEGHDAAPRDRRAGAPGQRVARRHRARSPSHAPPVGGRRSLHLACHDAAPGQAPTRPRRSPRPPPSCSR